MHGKGWLRVLGDGLLTGLIASLLMTLVMLLLRDRLGIATPAEMVGDRLAPRLSIYEFLTLLVRYGGYNQLKQVGVSSVLGGQLAVGVVGGALYALIVAWQDRRRSGQFGRFGGGRAGPLLVGLFMGGVTRNADHAMAHAPDLLRRLATNAGHSGHHHGAPGLVRDICGCAHGAVSPADRRHLGQRPCTAS
jgi:hypothetical protein